MLVFRVKTNTRTTLHLSAGMRGSVPSSLTSGKGNVAHGETSVPVANGDWIVLVCLSIVSAARGFHNSVGVGHHPSCVALYTRFPGSSTFRGIFWPVTSLASPVCLYLEMMYVALALWPLQQKQLLYLSNQTNLSKHSLPSRFLLSHGLPSKAFVTPH